VKLTKKEQTLIDFIIGELDKYHGSLIFHEGKMAKYYGKDYSSGFFEYPGINNKIKYPRLHVAIGCSKPIWLGVLLHEFCHFKQWSSQSDAWKKYCNSSSIEESVNLERECEKMTINLIRKNKLGDLIDITRYIETANTYLLFYQIYAITNRWYDIPPFSSKMLCKAVPSKLIRKPFTYKMDDSLVGAYLRICYKRKP